ncbi:hypothetical protein HDV00_009589 [Rhizophlyctis rosea]|nr:hypothetical protein HDV00_009589 [Rhizophlyctis rosea]
MPPNAETLRPRTFRPTSSSDEDQPRRSPRTQKKSPPTSTPSATSKQPKKTIASAPHASAWTPPPFTLKEVRDAVPAHCFERSAVRSMGYLLRDFVYMTILVGATRWADGALERAELSGVVKGMLKTGIWMTYWWCMGIVMTGVWVIAHECGHGAFSPSPLLNNSVGYILHTALLVPYFSWKYTHSKHHKANAHLAKDTVHLPRTRSRFPRLPPYAPPTTPHHDESIWHDAPLYDLLDVVKMLSVGWWGYLLYNVSGQKTKGRWSSHFNPTAPMFTPKQYLNILLSDIGVLTTLSLLFLSSHLYGTRTMLAYYFIPYMLVNMWLVLITFLQHTDVRVPHFRGEGEWTFLIGALSTVDRDYGWLNGFLHHIGDTHVAHHLFSTVPHYHAQEATEAMRGVLGKWYLATEENIWKSLWKSYQTCRFVEDEGVEGDVVWFKH